jgi:hypothetical protein
MERAPPTPNPEGSSAMGQVSGRRAARAPLPAAGRLAGSPRLRGRFSQRCRSRGRVQRIRIFFVFIDFQRKKPAPALMAPGSVPEPSRPRSGAVRCGRQKRLRPASAHTRPDPARSYPRTTRDARLAAVFARENAAVAETRPLAPPTPFGRGMSPRRRGRIPETSGESIFQRIALARTFYPRRRRRSRHAGTTL